jgi:hypothetical protein
LALDVDEHGRRVARAVVTIHLWNSGIPRIGDA